MSVIVEKAGLLDTIQDGGRYHLAHLGINSNGPMDWYAHELSNALVGNAMDAPVIEMHYPASTLRFLEPTVIALTGADFGASVNNIALPVNRTVKIPAGARLHFARKVKGERAYLSIKDGWQVPAALESYSTNIRSNFGGYNGRKLMAGDTISYRPYRHHGLDQVQLSKAFVKPMSWLSKIRVLPGPEWHWLDEPSKRKVLEQPFKLNTHSDRMAFSWQSEPLYVSEKKEMISSAVAFGTVQLLPSGQVLTLMADHQTVGGYPRVLQVIKSDLPSLAQHAPGVSIQFELCDIKSALQEWKQLKSDLQQIAANIQFQTG